MGLLGTSLAMDLKKRGHKVVGVEKSNEYLQVLRSSGFEDIYHVNDPAIFSEFNHCEGIIIGTPVDQVIEIIKTFEKNNLHDQTWVTDMASTKGELMQKVNDFNHSVNFIGSHPMAGSDLSGPSHARCDMFSKATIFITPMDNIRLDKANYDQSLRSLKNFWSSLGAYPHMISPLVHDKWAAYLSHGLHLVSCMVSCMLDDIPGVYEMNNPPAGGSFRDITRVAGSNPDLWDGIIKSNSREVSQYLESLEKLVKDWKEKLITENLPVKEIFQKSALIRSKIIKNTDSSKEGNHGNHNS